MPSYIVRAEDTMTVFPEEPQAQLSNLTSM
jgi:hypothetical protein